MDALPMGRSGPPKPTKRLGFTALALALVGAGALADWGWRQIAQPLPADYQTLETVVSRLAAHNNLGNHPIGFSINNGSYAAVLAEMRGYCKDESCDFYAQLNPYKSYGKDWDEISRQSYTLGDVGGWSTSSGTVEIPRAAFRIYGSRTDWLACTVAHELAHINRQHVFQASYYANNTIRSQPSKEQEKLNYAKSRQQELEADRDAAVMLARAGYRGRVCLNDLVFIHQSSGDGSATETDSTHPGYNDRTKAMATYYAELEAHPPIKTKGTQGHFSYSAADNLLRFIPNGPDRALP